MQYVLKMVGPGDAIRWAVVTPGFEDRPDPTAARNPDPDPEYATRFTYEQAQRWQAALTSRDVAAEIEAA